MHAIVASQYGAALAMLRRAIEECPEDVWSAASYRNRTWQIAYHTLFYAHLYIMPSEQDFTPWEHHRDDYHKQSNAPEARAYSKDEVLSYLDVVNDTIERVLPTLDLEADESGFHWLPFGKLELQIYNIRHIQGHAGELSERIYVAAQREVEWVGRTKPVAPA